MNVNDTLIDGLKCLIIFDGCHDSWYLGNDSHSVPQLFTDFLQVDIFHGISWLIPWRMKGKFHQQEKVQWGYHGIQWGYVWINFITHMASSLAWWDLDCGNHPQIVELFRLWILYIAFHCSPGSEAIGVLASSIGGVACLRFGRCRCRVPLQGAVWGCCCHLRFGVGMFVPLGTPL